MLNDFANYIDEKTATDEQVLLAKKSDGFRGDTYFGEILRKPDENFKSFKTKGSVASQNLTEKIIIRDYQKFYNGDIKGWEDIKPAQESKASYHGNALYYYQLFKRIKEFQEQNGNYFISNIEKKSYILIIDEINRGNISQIFGELITLIESNKRAGADETISVTLPYSKEDFSVPKNLYIIGTMNTADRSLTLMDTALRRRFDFIEILPNPTLTEISTNCDGVNLQNILRVINQRIEILYDKEHLIGHSFLMKVDTFDKLKNAFKNKILPLLEEYFYDDFNKICKILNDNNAKFYKKIVVDKSLFFDNETIETEIYQKTDIGELEPADFQQIYKNKDES